MSGTEALSYYKGKRVFITGHTGFKGAWLGACLYGAGAKIKGYALEPVYENGLFQLLQSLDIWESVIADIRDKERLENELHSFKPDFVFHLAAQPIVRRSYEIPAETFDVNVTGTANLLECISGFQGKSSIIVITTDKVYENKEKDILYNEDDKLGGFDPYSASKACTEMVISSFRNSFFNLAKFDLHKKGISVARAGNVIGGGDWSKDRIVPDIIRALQNEAVLQVRNPASVRPWQHVLEPILGYLMLGMRLDQDPNQFSMPFNFGPEPLDHLTVREIVEQAISTWGHGNWKDVSGKEKVHEAGLLKLDIGRAKKVLQWHPKLSARDAVDWTVSWYKKQPGQQADFTFEQIKKYFSL